MGSVVVARGLYSTGSIVVAHRLSCSAACGIFLDQGSNPCPLHWQADSFFFFLAGGFLTTVPPGKSLNLILSYSKTVVLTTIYHEASHHCTGRGATCNQGKLRRFLVVWSTCRSQPCLCDLGQVVFNFSSDRYYLFTTMWHRCYSYLCFTFEETRPQWGEMTCPGLQKSNSKWQSQNSSLGLTPGSVFCRPFLTASSQDLACQADLQLSGCWMEA